MSTPLPWISCLLVGLFLAFSVFGSIPSTPASAAPSGSAVPEVQAVPRYDRDAFGDRWADVDHDCQDTRNEVLIRDLVDERLDARGCRVMSGVLHDAYTGSTVEFLRGPKTSDAVQIDHVVPLAYAWKSGAWRWSDAEREAFANDPRELLAVDGRTNQAKAADGPASWLPPNIAAHCSYAQHWAEVLHAYDLTPLSADAAELDAITKECTR